MAGAPRGPLDQALTATLLASALDLLARDGLGRITTDRVASHARAGKAAVLRRWSSLHDLLAHAVDTCALVPPADDRGSMREDLVALLRPWTRPMNRGERAAAALLGHAGRGTTLDAALVRNVVEPLTASVHRIADRQAARGQALSPVQRRLLVVVVQSLWWQRYAGHVDPATDDGVGELVDRVLLPVATG